MAGGLAFFVWHGCYGQRAFQGIRRQIGNAAGKADEQQVESCFVRRGGDGGNPIVLRDNGYGGRLCQCGDHEIVFGSGNHYGGKCGNDGDVLDPEPGGDREQ